MNKYVPNKDSPQDSTSPDNLLLYESNQFYQPNQPNRNILNLKHTNIKEVWDYNFEEEIYKIMDLIEIYNVIAVVYIFLIILHVSHLVSGY
jgi:hypothetical protein